MRRQAQQRKMETFQGPDLISDGPKARQEWTEGRGQGCGGPSG